MRKTFKKCCLFCNRNGLRKIMSEQKLYFYDNECYRCQKVNLLIYSYSIRLLKNCRSYKIFLSVGRRYQFLSLLGLSNVTIRKWLWGHKKITWLSKWNLLETLPDYLFHILLLMMSTIFNYRIKQSHNMPYLSNHWLAWTSHNIIDF